MTSSRPGKAWWWPVLQKSSGLTLLPPPGNVLLDETLPSVPPRPYAPGWGQSGHGVSATGTVLPQPLAL